jgi:hypothetical protein
LAEHKEAQHALRSQITSIMWHMRGSVTREDAWTLSPIERKDMLHLIEEHIKLVEKTKLPLL